MSWRFGRLLGGGVSAVVALVAVVAAGPAGGALPAECTQAAATITCTYTSGTNAFTVPDDVSTVHVVAVGAPGGASSSSSGGEGARVSGDVSVTPGSKLWALVGGAGASGTGGFNGGGAGDTTAGAAGGGGGASDVRTSSGDASTRLLVAAGGGGGGAGASAAGGAGGDAGSAGDTGGGFGGSGGGAGASAAGGAAGACCGSGAGTGSLGAGGAGGTGDTFDSPAHAGGGGGGGGGLYGGGGGGGGGADTIPNSQGEVTYGGGGGGGGGSNLVPSGGAATLDTTGTPEVVISYSSPAVATPTSLAFGQQLVGTSSSSQTVTLSNTGGSGLAVSAATLTGTNPGDFSITSDGCSGTNVAAGSSCAVDITFDPTASGARSAALSFADDAFDSPQTVALSGVGITLADVKVAITGPATAAPGSQDTYVLTVSNAGPSTAQTVTVSAQIPTGTKFVGVVATQGTCTHPASGSTSGSISCALGDLGSGAAAIETATLKIVLTGKGGSIALAAKAASSVTPDPNLGNNVTSLTTTVSKK